MSTREIVLPWVWFASTLAWVAAMIFVSPFFVVLFVPYLFVTLGPIARMRTKSHPG